VDAAIADLRPAEVYYLATGHSSSQAAGGDLLEEYLASVQVNVLGVLHFLEAIRRHSPTTRLFFASSSLVFGNAPAQVPQDETTPTNPQEAYALAKLLASAVCRDYRRRHSVFASVGILFNHESSLRPLRYLSAKVVRAAVAASRGQPAELVVGDLDSVTDWGYAPDFVDAFTRILALPEPDDFVVATGIGHTVRDFLAAAFSAVGLDWTNYARVEPGLLARPRSGRIGNAAKLHQRTGWQPSLDFAAMVRTLVEQSAREDRP
jgi:GDPmannose 4,6-dehydratase